MTAVIRDPGSLWHADYDPELGDSPDGALDRIVRRLLAPVPDLTIDELDRLTESGRRRRAGRHRVDPRGRIGAAIGRLTR